MCIVQMPLCFLRAFGICIAEKKITREYLMANRFAVTSYRCTQGVTKDNKRDTVLPFGR